MPLDNYENEIDTSLEQSLINMELEDIDMAFAQVWMNLQSLNNKQERAQS